MATAILGCGGDDIVTPTNAVRVDGPSVLVSQSVAGCARVSVHVDLATAGVSVQDGATCGTLVPERDSEPVFDQGRRVLRLPIVLRNATTSVVSGPVRVAFTADSVVRWRNGQRAPGSGSTRALGADSMSTNGRQAVWRFDTLLAPSGTPQQLAPGARSRRLWLEFTGPELWLRPGGADADTTLSLRLDATGLATQAATVPATAPDSVPIGMYSDTNIVRLLPADTILIVKNVVLVGFEESATVEQRSAAVAAVGGEVIGGTKVADGDGIYFVRLPSSGPDAVMAAAAQLNALPQVGAASPEVILDSLALDYRRPRDHADVGPWEVRPELNTVDMNWAFERVAAPLAWGCSTGDPSVSIGILDDGFHRIDDLAPNVAAFPAYDFFDSNRHGTAMASIIGAEGNNGSGMAGMMWQAGLRYYNRTRLWPGVPGFRPLRATTSRDVHLLGLATLDGARAINMSINGGLEPVRPTARDSARADSARVAVVSQFALQIRRLDARGFRPLLVLSAGNVDALRPSLNVHMNGYPELVEHFPDRVIVVASSTRADELDPASKRGSLVSLAAPGVDVIALNQNSEIRPSNGTSPAAAIVTGAAGLLFAFDPRLTAAEVKAFVIQGAIRGNRRTNIANYPILNAYESLRLAAQRQGAGLCDNRIWELNGGVRVRRDRTNPALDETLFNIDEPVGFLNAVHGGKRVDLLRTDAFRTTAFLLNNGTWTETTDYRSLPEAVRAGAANSMERLSHDGDRSVTAGLAGNGTFTVRVENLITHVETVVGSVAPSVPAGGGSAQYCMQRIADSTGSSCVDERTFTTGALSYTFTPAFSPLDDQVLLALSGRRTTVLSNDERVCGGDDQVTVFCRTLTFSTEDINTEVWSISLTGGAPTRLWGATGFAIFDMAVSESGRELITQQGSQRIVSSTSGGTATVTWNNCSLAFRAHPTGTVLQAVPNTAACFGYPGNGSFSPMVAPTNGTGLTGPTPPTSRKPIRQR